MRYFLLSLLLSSQKILIGQIGGETSFNNLNRSYNARAISLGSNFITSKDADINIGVINPSLLNNQMHNKWGINQVFQTGGINSGMLVTAKHFTKYNITQSYSLRYVDYGKMNQTSETGEIIGSFIPADFILSSGFGKQLNERFNIGMQFNLLYSQYSQYASLGGSFDFGGSYEIKDKKIVTTLLVKNIGYQFINFLNQPKHPLPTEIQFAYSHTLSHAPIRFSYLIHHLNRWDLSYNDPNISSTIDPLTGDSIFQKKANLAQKLFHHFTPQIEILMSKNLHFRFAFDYHRRNELLVENRPGLAGFSFGFGYYFKRFNFEYGFSSYSIAGSLNAITLSTNFENWKKKY